MCEPFCHMLTIKKIGLNQKGMINDRILSFLDSNDDLYLIDVMKSDIVKIDMMVTSMQWHEQTNILTTISNKKFVCHYFKFK